MVTMVIIIVNISFCSYCCHSNYTVYNHIVFVVSVATESLHLTVSFDLLLNHLPRIPMVFTYHLQSELYQSFQQRSLFEILYQASLTLDPIHHLSFVWSLTIGQSFNNSVIPRYSPIVFCPVSVFNLNDLQVRLFIFLYLVESFNHKSLEYND